jgi:hypothetical protein
LERTFEAASSASLLFRKSSSTLNGAAFGWDPHPVFLFLTTGVGDGARGCDTFSPAAGGGGGGWNDSGGGGGAEGSEGGGGGGKTSVCESDGGAGTSGFLWPFITGFSIATSSLSLSNRTLSSEYR